MPRVVLSPAAVHRAFERVRPQLGESDRDRVSAVLRLMAADGAIPLGVALEVLYPQADRELALASFRQLRARVAQAARESGLRFSLEVDSRKRTAPEARSCWFAGDDQAGISATEYSGEESATLTAGTPVTQEALVSTEVLNGKPVIRYFVSYAHKDQRLRDDLLRRVQERLAASREFSFVCWDDNHLLVGDTWHEKIQTAIQQCHFGLLLVSYAFITSSYITERELPNFVSNGRSIGWRRAVPVGLRALSLDGSVDLKGLNALQIFRDSERKFYSERTTEQTKDRFAEELFQGIRDVVRRNILQPEKPQMPARIRKPGRAADVVAEHQRIDLLTVAEGSRVVPPEGIPSDLDKLKEEVRTVGAAGERRDAVEYLLQWARDPASPSFCALLGESGIGKTTTCKFFTQRLLAARERDQRLPLPIYLDLRHLGEAAQTNPSIETILATVIARSWRVSPGTSRITPDEILRLVADEGALVIFDGLDEVLVHLTPRAGQQFTRELWRILPGIREPRRPRPAGKASSGKLLISCRTHYFRTLREQKTHLTGEDREGVSTRDYQALVLLPFRREQIETYLRTTLPGQDIPALLKLISAIHNLPELAERPYTLSLIAEQIPNLERWRTQGHRVTGVTLYRHVVSSWLERDQGKHQLQPSHKQRLMEHLAAALWRSGKQSWMVDDLEQWLIDFLIENPRLAAHYTAKDREVLKEDLRTATFLVRQGESDFRFAHTSLQEFFLASYLYRALRERCPADWDMHVPSIETLDFVGQLLREDCGNALKTLRGIRNVYCKGRSELALAYGLRAHERDWPSHSLIGSQLNGADLRNVLFESARKSPLSLEGSNFANARLERIGFHDLVLDGANFTNARLEQAEFLNTQMRNCLATGATFSGTIFRDVDLDGSDLSGALFHRTQFLRCRMHDVRGTVAPPNAFLALCEPEPTVLPNPTRSDARLELLTSHASGVNCVVFSPDGRWLVTGGEDGLVYVRDPVTCEPLRALRGHLGGVRSCAFSPDGKYLSSAGLDGCIRVCHAATGEFLLELGGHEHAIRSCIFSPDGQQIHSVDSGGLLCTWNAATGARLRSVRIAHEYLHVAEFSPDGSYLACVSEPARSTVQLWKTATGEHHYPALKHKSPIVSCSFCSDGSRLASISENDDVGHVWDVATGKLIHITSEALHSWRCALSPDAQHVAYFGEGPSLHVWNTKRDEWLHNSEEQDGWVETCTFAPDGRHIVSADDMGTMHVWNSTSGELVTTAAADPVWVYACTFSPDGRTLASFDFYGDINIWNATSGQPVNGCSQDDHPFLTCGFLRDGRLVSVSADSTIKLWNTNKGKSIRTLQLAEGPRVSISSDRRPVLSADVRHVAWRRDDGRIGVWDTSTGNLLSVYGNENSQGTGAISFNTRYVASAAIGGVVQVWDLTSTASLWDVRDGASDGQVCVLSPHHEYLATSGDGVIRIWEPATGRIICTLDGHVGRLQACAFLPDGERLASAGEDGTVRIWNLATGRLLRILNGHDGAILCVALTHDGRHIAGGSRNGTLRVWEIETARELFAIHYFPYGDFALTTDLDQKLLGATFNAWRWIGWVAPNAKSSELTRFPAETFGPLPWLEMP